jgi:hypothetical protein
MLFNITLGCVQIMTRTFSVLSNIKGTGETWKKVNPSGTMKWNFEWQCMSSA